MSRRTKTGYAVCAAAIVGGIVGVFLGADVLQYSIGSVLVVTGMLKLTCGTTKATESELRAYAKWKEDDLVTDSLYVEFRNSCLRQYLRRQYGGTASPGLSKEAIAGWLRVSTSLSVITAPGAALAGIVFLGHPWLSIPASNVVLGNQTLHFDNTWTVTSGIYFVSGVIMLTWCSLRASTFKKLEVWKRWLDDGLIEEDQWKALGNNEFLFSARSAGDHTPEFTLKIPYKRDAKGSQVLTFNGSNYRIDAAHNGSKPTGTLVIAVSESGPEAEAHVSIEQSNTSGKAKLPIQGIATLDVKDFESIKALERHLVWHWRRERIEILKPADS